MLIIALILINSKESKKVLLSCNLSNEESYYSYNNTLNLYETKGTRYYEEKIVINYDENVLGDDKEAFLKFLNYEISNYKKTMDYYNEVDGISLDIKSKMGKITMSSKIDLSKVSQSDYPDLLSHDYTGENIQIIKALIEGDGLICTEY